MINLNQYHCVFERLDTKDNPSYTVIKDVFGHVSEGARVSNTMLNHLLTTLPTAARVYIIE